MQADLSGKVAIVTGAGGYIGSAICEIFTANGAIVYYTDIDDRVREAAAKTNSPWVTLDVSDEQQVNSVISQIVAERGRLDICVNNAGFSTLEHRVTIDEFPREEWDRLINVNLTGVYQVSHAAARAMRRQGGGRIINIASVTGIVPLRLQCAYVAAKAGVVNLTKSTAIELGPYGILTNAIAPGSTLTEGTRKLFYGPDGKFSDAVQRMLDHVPLGRPGNTHEMAVAALFLAAPENSYMNGHTLVVDGGWTAGYTRDF